MLSVRQLVLLAVVTLLPVAVFAAITLSILEERGRNGIEEQLRQSARTAASAVERNIAQEFAALATLASSDALGRGDVGAFTVQARRAVEARPSWLAVILADHDRQLVNTRVPEGEALPTLLDPDNIALVLDTGAPQVSGIVRRPEWRTEPVIGLRVPVIQDGRAVQVLTAVVSAWTFNALIKEHVTAEGGRITLIDHKSQIVARSSSPGPGDPVIGSRPTDSVLEGLRSGGVYEATLLDGEHFLIASAAVPRLGWTVTAGAPQRVVMAPLVRSRLFLFGGGALALVLATLLGACLIVAFTRRQEAERQLEMLRAEKAAERRLADIAANFPGIIYRCVRHPDGRMTYPYISESPTGFLGRRLESLQGGSHDPADTAAALMDADTAKRWLEAIDRTARTLEPLHLDGVIVDPGGRRHHFRTHATTRRDEDGAVVWDGVLLDVSDLHAAERARREGEDRLAFALAEAHAGLWDWDIPTNRITWSQSLWSLFGIDAPGPEPTPEIIDRLLHPEDRDTFWAATRAAMDSGASLTLEFRVVRAGGEIRWIGAIGRGFVDAEGRAARMTGLYLDITDRKRIEDQLHHAKEEAERANIAKSKFLAAASHDLRQPVQSLLFFAHVLGERLAGHDARDLVGTMQQALDALKGLLDGILDLSKLDAGVVVPQREVMPVGPLLQRLGAEYAPRFAEKGLTLKVRGCDEVVDSDPTLLGRIVGNLMENALKYTSRGGVLVGCRRRGDSVRIEVWDTGIGIPRGRFEDIFEEFVQIGNPERDRTQGLGLGLAIVKRLSRLLDHPVTVRSSAGRGSVFMVTVPLGTGAVATAPGLPRCAPAAADQELAVIIDDEAIILEGMQAMMEDWGYRVLAAGDLETALTRLGADLVPDVVVADFHLRDGQTGVGAIRAVRDVHGESLPAILLTGDTDPELGAEAERHGFAILHKPVHPDGLRRLLRDLLHPGRGGGRRGARAAAD